MKYKKPEINPHEMWWGNIFATIFCSIEKERSSKFIMI